ncbi:DNA binding domain-containing protein, excisionase family [Sphingopyxis sp. YR583]|uniref:helix-turn-helix domain-containing protein n=1 Tax=Sphingopyxis sp. YR583 TaxID=1881047 RepID=UPI0008A7D978|nr:helix-turn-helix domain-containing protein [Sphingopyxis sp. YR583]SEH12497.1 DNA binding domain-containing protein, excisionase family [Sphingopyxis sp. YR583]
MRKRQRKSSTVGNSDAAAIRPLCVTINEAADMLSLGRTSIYQLIAEGALVAIKIGTCTRVTTASLDQFTEQLASRQA